MHTGKKLYLWLCVFVFALISLNGTAQAQYFGQSKVQYKDFNFKVLKSEHFDIYFYPEEQEAAQITARLAERWFARHARMFNHELRGRQALILYACHPDFEQTNAISGALGEGTGGVTEAIKRRIVLPFGSSLQEADHVIGHELVHAFQYDITGEDQHARVGFAAPTALRLPLWLIEGMAEYYSLGPIDAHTAMWMRDASQNKLPDYKDLLNPQFFPYRYGQALLAYIAGVWGDRTVGLLLKDAGRSGDIDHSIRRLLAVGPDTLIQKWQQTLHAAYDPLAKVKKQPADYGRLLISGEGKGNDVNVGPAVSPDGKYVVFLSSRSLFSIDMFLADAETGRIIRKITKSALDPHFESLQFIYSSGTWDSKSERFAFSAISKGRPVLSILNVKRDKIEREIKFKQLDEIFNPTWSPDGRYIAFSAIVGGLSDLFIYDLQTGDLKRVTEDAFADLQPAWSPDGRTIAFVTERFSTDLSDLQVGKYRLAAYDFGSGSIRALPSFTDGKNINPRWSPDSGTIYFVSDHEGIANLYRLSLDAGDIEQLTDLFTGVSGITAISPAVSVASQSGRLVFSAFEKGKYNLYAVDRPESLSPTQFAWPERETRREGVSLALLPPVQRYGDDLLKQLHDPLLGLPPDTTYQVRRYHPGLSLDYIGQPYLAVGADRFGTYIGGGASLFWSDMLGNHNLATMLQVQGNFKEVAGLAAYQNVSHRLNWGVAAQQYPYVTGTYASGLGIVSGDTAFVEETLIQRQTNRSLSSIFSYPFDRTKRLEFSAGYTNITFHNEADIQAFSLLTGDKILDRNETLPSPGALNFLQGEAAYVYDNTYFGVASPILGQRYRFEVAPTVGSLFYYNVLADYRKYLMPVRPYTLAFRLLHYGRYGKDAEDVRLSPLFLGYPGLVRGYDFYSLDPNECISSDCRGVNQLFGSKLAVANVELRVPLYNLITLGRGFFYGMLPIEVAAFYDAGVAWQDDDKAFFLNGDRNLISSVGVAMRINLGGYLLFEFDYVHPYDRPQKGWIFQFSMTPGF